MGTGDHLFGQTDSEGAIILYGFGSPSNGWSPWTLQT